VQPSNLTNTDLDTLKTRSKDGLAAIADGSGVAASSDLSTGVANQATSTSVGVLNDDAAAAAASFNAESLKDLTSGPVAGSHPGVATSSSTAASSGKVVNTGPPQGDAPAAVTVNAAIAAAAMESTVKANGDVEGSFEDKPMPQKRLNFDANPFVPQAKAVQFNPDPLVAEFTRDYADMVSDASAASESKEDDEAMEVDAGGTLNGNNTADSSEAPSASAKKVPTALEATLDAVINEGSAAASQKTLLPSPVERLSHKNPILRRPSIIPSCLATLIRT
jgi:hypothetical protein